MKDVSFDFSGKTVIVTGGSSGIGYAIARAFRDAGAKLLVTGTRATPNDYPDDLAEMTFHSLDMRDRAAIAGFAEGVEEADVLINNAGTAIRSPESYEPDRFSENIEINLNAVYRLSHALLPKLKESRGSIVNIASMTSYFGSPRIPGYGASKAGILQLTQSLAALWAADGIRVNALAPGWILTKLTVPVRENDTLNRAILSRTPMARWGEPDDLAGGALFLASDAAAFITGVTIPVDGGFSSCGV